MFKEIEIKSVLSLPYKLIDIDKGEEHFVFAFKCFDEKQSDYSIQMGGVTGKFEVIYRCYGIESQFECDITIGNVYDFYIQLNNVYGIHFGKDTIANLKNYGNILKRTNLTFSLDNNGHCTIIGSFKNKGNLYKSGIEFEIEIDQTYIPEILASCAFFFKELTRIQGHGTFY